MNAPEGTLITRDGWHYKLSERGLAYRWSGAEWKRTTCIIEKTQSGYVLRMPRTNAKVVNRKDIVPLSHFVNRQ